MPLKHARHVFGGRSSAPAAVQPWVTLLCASITWRPHPARLESLQWSDTVARVSARSAKRLAVCRVGDLPVRNREKGSTPKVTELPQGLIDGGPAVSSEKDDAPVYPALLQQVRNHMIKYEGSVLLTKVGQFYEVRCK